MGVIGIPHTRLSVRDLDRSIAVDCSVPLRPDAIAHALGHQARRA